MIKSLNRKITNSVISKVKTEKTKAHGRKHRRLTQERGQDIMTVRQQSDKDKGEHRDLYTDTGKAGAIGHRCHT